MVDHALQNGWDKINGGFYDEGYYFRNKKDITIIRDSKNCGHRLNGLNTLIADGGHFPNDPMQYFEKFKMSGSIFKLLIDHVYGDWYEEGT
jgi:mannobiose 2-epimerase